MVKTEVCNKGKKEGGEEPLVNDQNNVSSRSPESGDLNNIEPKTLRVAPEQGGFHGVKNPEASKQQPTDPNLEAFRQRLGRPRRPIVAGGEAHIRNQRRWIREEAVQRLGKPSPEGLGEETGLSEELQQRESDYVARVNAWLANSSFTEDEKQGHKERLIDILDTQDTQVAMLKDLSWVREDMQRAGFDHPVEWLISQGDVIPAPPGFHRFRPPMSLWRRELHQLYRDKVKEVVRYWREQGFL
jgi:hypothetical protein